MIYFQPMNLLKTVLFNPVIFKLQCSGGFLQFYWEFRRDPLWGRIICYLSNADFAASPKVFSAEGCKSHLAEIVPSKRSVYILICCCLFTQHYLLLAFTKQGNSKWQIQEEIWCVSLQLYPVVESNWKPPSSLLHKMNCGRFPKGIRAYMQRRHILNICMNRNLMWRLGIDTCSSQALVLSCSECSSAQSFKCPGSLPAQVGCDVQTLYFPLCLDLLKAAMFISERENYQYFTNCVPETLACCLIHVKSNSYIVLVPKIQNCNSLAACQAFMLSVL